MYFSSVKHTHSNTYTPMSLTPANTDDRSLSAGFKLWVVQALPHSGTVEVVYCI